MLGKSSRWNTHPFASTYPPGMEAMEAQWFSLRSALFQSFYYMVWTLRVLLDEVLLSFSALPQPLTICDLASHDKHLVTCEWASPSPPVLPSACGAQKPHTAESSGRELAGERGHAMYRSQNLTLHNKLLVALKRALTCLPLCSPSDHRDESCHRFLFENLHISFKMYWFI